MKPPRIIGLVGASGSGKTTVANELATRIVSAKGMERQTRKKN